MASPFPHLLRPWGLFQRLAYSTWDSIRPIPTGYSPNMFIHRDETVRVRFPRPICHGGDATTPALPLGCVTAQTNPPIMITDPYFNPLEHVRLRVPVHAGRHGLLEAVVPVMHSPRLNPPDCRIPVATPAIKSRGGDEYGHDRNG